MSQQHAHPVAAAVRSHVPESGGEVQVAPSAIRQHSRLMAELESVGENAAGTDSAHVPSAVHSHSALLADLERRTAPAAHSEHILPPSELQQRAALLRDIRVMETADAMPSGVAQKQHLLHELQRKVPEAESGDVAPSPSAMHGKAALSAELLHTVRPALATDEVATERAARSHLMNELSRTAEGAGEGFSPEQLHAHHRLAAELQAKVLEADNQVQTHPSALAQHSHLLSELSGKVPAAPTVDEERRRAHAPMLAEIATVGESAGSEGFVPSSVSAKQRLTAELARTVPPADDTTQVAPSVLHSRHVLGSELKNTVRPALSMDEAAAERTARTHVLSELSRTAEGAGDGFTPERLAQHHRLASELHAKIPEADEHVQAKPHDLVQHRQLLQEVGRTVAPAPTDDDVRRQHNAGVLGELSRMNESTRGTVAPPSAVSAHAKLTAELSRSMPLADDSAQAAPSSVHGKALVGAELRSVVRPALTTDETAAEKEARSHMLRELSRTAEGAGAGFTPEQLAAHHRLASELHTKVLEADSGVVHTTPSALSAHKHMLGELQHKVTPAPTLDQERRQANAGLLSEIARTTESAGEEGFAPSAIAAHHRLTAAVARAVPVADDTAQASPASIHGKSLVGEQLKNVVRPALTTDEAAAEKAARSHVMRELERTAEGAGEAFHPAELTAHQRLAAEIHRKVTESEKSEQTTTPSSLRQKNAVVAELQQHVPRALDTDATRRAANSELLAELTSAVEGAGEAYAPSALVSHNRLNHELQRMVRQYEDGTATETHTMPSALHARAAVGAELMSVVVPTPNTDDVRTEHERRAHVLSELEHTAGTGAAPSELAARHRLASELKRRVTEDESSASHTAPSTLAAKQSVLGELQSTVPVAPDTGTERRQANSQMLSELSSAVSGGTALHSHVVPRVEHSVQVREDGEGK